MTFSKTITTVNQKSPPVSDWPTCLAVNNEVEIDVTITITVKDTTAVKDTTWTITGGTLSGTTENTNQTFKVKFDSSSISGHVYDSSGHPSDPIDIGQWEADSDPPGGGD